MKVKTILIIASILVIVLGIYYVVDLFHKGLNASRNNPTAFEKSGPKDYTGLFNNNAQQKLVSTSGLSFKLRNTVIIYEYDKKYDIEITKININPVFYPGKDILETYNETKGSFPEIRFPYHEANFTANYRSESPDTVSKLYLSLNGDSLKTVLKNDSVANYYLKLKNVYVQFRPGSVYEIYVKPDDNSYSFANEQPINLMFLKKNRSLYFLLLTPKDGETKLDPYLLRELIR